MTRSTVGAVQPLLLPSRPAGSLQLCQRRQDQLGKISSRSSLALLLVQRHWYAESFAYADLS